MKVFALAVACILLQESRENSNPLPALEESFRYTEKGVVGLDFEPTGATLAVGGDGYVATFDLKTLKVVEKTAQKDLVDEVMFDPEGKVLISRSKGPDTVVRRPGDLEPLKFAINWPGSTYDQLVGDLAGYKGSCPAAFSRDGTRLALVNGGRGFKVWGLEGLAGGRKIVVEMVFETLPLRKPPQDIRERLATPHALLNHGTAISFEGSRLWLGMEDGFVIPIAPAYFKALDDPIDKSMPRQTPSPGAPDPNVVNKIQTLTLKKAHVFHPHDGDVTSITFFPGDQTFMTSGTEGKVKIWNTREVLDRKPPANDVDRHEEPQPLKTLNGHFACMSAGGRFVAVAETGGVRTYDQKTLAPVSWTPTDPKLGCPTRVKFSPDGSRLAATICNCATCSKSKALYTLAPQKMRSHHHGGTLIVWSTRAAKLESPK